MTYANGILYADPSKKVVAEAGSAVPAGAMFHGGMAFNATTGALYVRVVTSPPAGSIVTGGVRLASDGALCVVTTQPATPYYQQGLTTDADGLVYVDTRNPLNLLGRWPIGILGSLCLGGQYLATDFALGTYDEWTGSPTGMANSKVGTALFSFRADADGTSRSVIHGAGFRLGLEGSNKLILAGTDSGGVSRFQYISTATYLSGSGWHTVLASWDMATGAVLVWVDGTQVTAWDTATTTNVALGYANAGNWRDGEVDGCLGPVWLDPTQAMDFTNSANRAKFITVAGKPIYLGANGELPTGTSPIVFLPNGDGTNNRGTGGNATVVGTGKSLCSSNPY